jgi:hypothetical protein
MDLFNLNYLMSPTNLKLPMDPQKLRPLMDLLNLMHLMGRQHLMFLPGTRVNTIKIFEIKDPSTEAANVIIVSSK